MLPDEHLDHVGNGAVFPVGGRAQRLLKGAMRNVSVLVLPVAMNLPGAANVLQMYCIVESNTVLSGRGRSLSAEQASSSRSAVNGWGDERQQ